MHEASVAGFLANLLVILVSAKVFGEIAERLKQPAVLGELVGGVILGSGLFAFFQPHDPTLELMAQFGVILLLFETGLHCDMATMLKAGAVSTAVASVGVIVPFVLGYVVMTLLGYSNLTAVFVGAALTATSVGITARVLSDMGQLSRAESQIVIGAAVIDDIMGLIILSAVQGIARHGSFSWSATLWTTFLSVIFLAVAFIVGPLVTKRLVSIVDRMRVRGVLITFAVSFAFTLALTAQALGSALIVGAFTAGILLAGTDKKIDIDVYLKPLADVFVPIFFIMVGAKVELGSFNPFVPANHSVIMLAGLLIAVAVVGKLASGWAAWGKNLDKLAIGIGMVPRGEVGLIFAQIGLAAGVIESPLYTAVVGMVVVTTFLAPILLRRRF